MARESSQSFDDVELQTVALKAPLNRKLAKEENGCLDGRGFTGMTDELVQTSHGEFLVSWKGERSKPALVTFHDLGLNAVSNFQAYFNYPDAAEILQQFCLFCINAPGQEEGAPTWPDDKVYPTMEDLAEAISEILNHFSVVRYIGTLLVSSIAGKGGKSFPKYNQINIMVSKLRSNTFLVYFPLLF